MQINQSEIKDLVMVLTLTVEPTDYQETVQKELKQLRQKVHEPGFRPGMIPLGLVKKKYGKSVLAEVINKTLSDALNGYIEEKNLNILGEPLPDEELSPKVDFDTQDTFTFAFDIALAPEFDASLSGHNKLTYYTVTVTDEMVNNQVAEYAQRFCDYVDADDVQDGDLIKGLITEQCENGISKDGAVIYPKYMVDSEQAALFMGAKKGDVITFNPQKAFQNEAEISSLLGISKQEAKELTSDFSFEITGITRQQAAQIDSGLFDKVYGEGVIQSEEDFRAHIKADLVATLAEESDYKFGIDAKAAVMKKMEGLVFPEAFLKRWLHATNEKITDEEIDKDFPQMIEELKWQLAKDQLLKKFDIHIEQADMEAYAARMTKAQFRQYGMMNIADEMLNAYTQHILKDEKQVRNIFAVVCEQKIYAALKGVVKIDEKTISHEDFGKLFA